MTDQTEDRPEQAQTDDDPAQTDAPEEAAAEDAEDQDAEKTDEQIAEEKYEKLKEAVGVEIEDVGTLRHRLSLTVPRELIDERLDEQFTELQRERDIRGFRRGRAPRRLVEKAYGSEVRDLIREQIIAQAYQAATEKKDLHVLGEPDLNLDEIKLPEEGNLEFSCVVEVKPEFELPELKGIPVKKPTVTITDADVDMQIERLQMRFGRYEPAEDGTVQIDDLVVADAKMSVDGEVVHEETNAQFAARPSRIEGIVVEGLGDALLGAKEGDQRSVEAEVPDDHENEKLRGKTAKFEFAVHDVKRLVLPTLDDDFAKMLGLESVAELKNMIKAESESRIDQEIQRGMRAQIRQYLAEKTELEIPAGLSGRQTERVVQRRMVELQRQGVPETEIEKNLDELRTTAKEQVAGEIRMFFILEKLGEEFGVDVTEDELNGQIAQIAQASNRRFDRVRDELVQRNGLQSLYISIRDEKCIDRLLQDAEITEVTPDEAEEAAESKKPKKKTKKATKKKKTKSKKEDDLADET
ncbi:MAG: trigger factor [Phycisphaerae bacterium]|nr:trigger factor [Phycisphaerae bacterium]